MTDKPTCRGCGHTRHPHQYLCPTCWHQLPSTTRATLNIKDGMPAARRLGKLLEQLRDGIPLQEIEINR